MICVPTSATLGARAGISASSLLIPSPTITSVTQDGGEPTTVLLVNIHRDQTFNWLHYQGFLDAGLTNPPATEGSGPVGFMVNDFQERVSSLTPSTQYWFRVAVSADNGATVSGWPNVVMGATQ